MRQGLVYGTLAYGLWGLFPFFFKQLQHVPSLQVVLHRMVWSLVFVLLVLAVLRRWAWLGDVRRRPRLLAVFAASSALLACNWLTYIWAVNNGHVLDASLGYFILPLVNVALGFLFLHERPRLAQWLAYGTAAAGVLWLALLTGHVPWIALALAVSFGFYGLIRKLAPLGALEGMSRQTLLLAPVAATALLWGQHSGTLPAQDARTWVLFALSGPVTAVPLLLFAAAARRVTLVTIGLLQFIAPILQFISGLALGEAMSPGRWTGFAIVWVALVVLVADSVRHQMRARVVSPPVG